MTYKKGLSKTKFKNTMRLFWTQRWRYERTVEQWVESLSKSYLLPPYGKRGWDLLFSACDKLVLEKKINKDEAENLKKMIEGTPEDAFIAISILAKLKPKKFKKVLT